MVLRPVHAIGLEPADATDWEMNKEVTVSDRDRVYKWRPDYVPRFSTKNGENNRRTYEALSDFIAANGPQTQDALEAHAHRFTWHHQYSANVPGGVEYVRWHISHGNLVPVSRR